MNVISQIVLKNAMLINAVTETGIGPGTQFKFNYNDTLRKATIYGFEVVPSSLLLTDQNGITVITGDYNLLTVSLQLEDSNRVIVMNLPYNRFNPALYNGYTQYIEPCKINWDQSYFTLNAPPTVIVANQSIPAIVYFQYDK